MRRLGLRSEVICLLAAFLFCWVGWLSCRCARADTAAVNGSDSDANIQTESFRLKLADPAFPNKPPRAETALQFKDANGFPAGYSMLIVTEVCTDNKCKLVEATLHWNALGYFERIECAADKPLTKKEHVPFDAEDYAKIHRILKDPNSILGQQSLAFLANPPPVEAEVDGWSGATPLTVQQSVVKDAAYTTWVMWRWANGEVVPMLRDITKDSCGAPYLRHLFGSEDRRAVDFALKHVREHHASDGQFVDEVFRVLETGDREHVTLALGFLSEAVKDKQKLHSRLIESLCRMKATYSPTVLAHFSAQPDLPPSTLEGLAAILGRLPYFQVHLILRMLEQREFSSKRTEADVVKLLECDDFFIARRAFEHLVEQDVSDNTQTIVNAFRQKHHDRL